MALNYVHRKLPDCWNDDERMNSLFSALRATRDINPYDWDSKVDFWSKVILESCRAENDVCIDCNTIAKRFRRKGSLPLCIEKVLLEMQKRRQIQSLDDYHRNVGDGWVSWGLGIMVRKPATWLLSFMYKGNHAPQGLFVASDLVKEKAEELLKVHHLSVYHENTDNILEYSELWDKCKNVFKNESVFSLVLAHQKKCKKICIQETKDGKKILKFCGRNSDVCSSLNETDLGIFSIKQTYSMLKNQSESITNDVESCKVKILAYLKNNRQKNDPRVKGLLLKMKASQKSLQKKEMTMENLHNILQKIQDANSDKMVIDAYRQGISAMARSQLTPEAVDETLLDVEEVLEKYHDIEDSFAKGHRDIEQTVLGVTDDELETELKDLLASDHQNNMSQVEKEMSGLTVSDNTNFIQDLPSVPLESLKDLSHRQPYKHPTHDVITLD